MSNPSQEADFVNVLLVDDQPNNLVAFEAMLSDLEIRCVRAESGTSALRRLLDEDFAVILLDVQMPGMDGFETANLIRQREKSRFTPIIFVTALSRNETNVFHGYSVGAVDYMFKPIVPEILRSKVLVFVELFRKNRKLETQTVQLERLIRQNELILNSAADGVIGVDLHGKATFVNPSAERMLDRPASRFIGGNLHDLLHPRTGPKRCNPETCELRMDLQGGPSYELHDSEFRRADGTGFPTEYSATPMRDEEGRHLGAVLTFRDVSERRAAAMARENERLYREAQAANKAKDDFLATLSHELRTPMTAILGWNELLGLDDIDDATRKEAVDAIRSSAKVQKQLIDDMLDVSRIIMDKFGIDLKPEPIASIVEAALEIVRHQAAERRIEIISLIDQQPAQVLADETRLRQVLWNLLTNAVKFTHEGGHISIRLEITEKTAVTTVSDDGSGIDPSMVPHIFDRLVQTDDGKNKGGLGLGLAIARHIVELHGGTIEARSDGIGRGAEFVVTLPLWNEHPSDQPNPAGVKGIALGEQ